MTPIEEPQEIEIPRGLVAESSAPMAVIQFPDGHTEPAPAGSVYAKDIIGLLTNEQIEELEAAKISGQLTPEQIEAINAAQIIGEIVNSQIKGIGAGKLEGFVAGTQIAAETITGGNIKALTITAGHIANESITTEKIAALNVTTAKLAANAITAEKISAGSITTTKIAASAVTAEKISVLTLSALSVNAGTITAGTFKGVTFETAEEGLKINNEGISLFVGEEETPNARRKIDWFKGATRVADLSATLTSAETLVRLNSIGAATSFESALITIEAKGKENLGASISLFSKKGKKEQTKITALVGSTTEESGNAIAILESGLTGIHPRSRFLQLAGSGIGAIPAVNKEVFYTTQNFSIAAGGTESGELTVTHNMGSTSGCTFGQIGASGFAIPINCKMVTSGANTATFRAIASSAMPGAVPITFTFFIAIHN